MAYQGQTVSTIVLGKNLLTDEELIHFAQSTDNHHRRNILELQRLSLDSALVSSMALIKLTKSNLFGAKKK